MKLFDRLTQWSKRLKGELYTLYFAYKDPRVPWYAKLLAGFIIAYAFSPIDLIPDFIPVLGYLDDVILVSIGIALAIRMIPQEVMEEARKKAAAAMLQEKPKKWGAAIVIIAIWIIVIVLVVIALVRF